MSSSGPDAQPTDAGLLDARNEVFRSVMANGRVSAQVERPFLKTLGSGGQGTVMLSERRGAGKFCIPVALKFFSPAGFGSEPDYDAEMLRQAEVSSMVARIQDDHLVDVHAFVRERGIYYMEMEWVDGFDLLHILRRDTLRLVRTAVTTDRYDEITKDIVTAGVVDCRLKPAMAVAIIRECLSGISALHREGVIHCDLKPSNVMVKRTGQVKIIDIGSAFSESMPPAGQPCTPEYAATEVLQGYRATPQSDLASLGYTLLEMLTGAKPFADMTIDEMIRARMTLIERLPSMLPREEFALSEPLIVLLRKLVHPDPSQRFATADEAETSDEGAAGFLKELVKSDLSREYASDLRQLMSEMDRDAGSAAHTPLSDGTPTVILPRRPAATTLFRTGKNLRPDSGDFDFDPGTPLPSRAPAGDNI